VPCGRPETCRRRGRGFMLVESLRHTYYRARPTFVPLQVAAKLDVRLWLAPTLTTRSILWLEERRARLACRVKGGALSLGRTVVARYDRHCKDASPSHNWAAAYSPGVQGVGRLTAHLEHGGALQALQVAG
jgi:hypothetical protein